MVLIPKERNSSLELLRIISMLLIMCAHFVVHGNYPVPTIDTFSLNHIVLQVIGSYAYVGVAAFMLITGYFMITSESRSVRKVIKLVTDIIFYSLLLLFLCYVLKLIPLTNTDLFGSIMPWGYYWFVLNYIIILLIAPYLNKLLIQLTKKQYLYLIVVGVVTLRILPCVLFGHFSVTSGTLDYFLLFYVIGGYIRLHVPKSEQNGRYLLVSMAMFLLVVLIAIIVDFVALRTGNNGLLKDYMHFRGLDSIPVDICAIALFLYFRNLVFVSKTVNNVARYTLDVYLVHENRLMMKVFWGGHFSLQLFSSHWFWLFAVGDIFLVYTLCTMIGWCKRKTWDVIFGKFLDRIENKHIRI